MSGLFFFSDRYGILYLTWFAFFLSLDVWFNRFAVVIRGAIAYGDILSFWVQVPSHNQSSVKTKN